MMIWAVDIAALDGDDVAQTLRFASGDYTQAPSSPTPYYYDLRLVQPALFQVRANTGPLLPGGGRSSVGQVELLNTDGGLNYLADYAVDGRAMTVRQITNGTAVTFLTATVERMTFSGQRVVFALRDPLATLDDAIATDVYAGDNVLPAGVEGTNDDIGGTNKPLVFGSAVNASPVLVNTSKLIYQVHDGSDVTVTAVRDRGVALTFESTATDLADLLATAPSAGQWRTFEGYFSLGSAAQSVTCDAARDVIAAGAVFGEISTLAGFTTNAADITALNLLGDVGLYVTSDTTHRSLLENIAHGCGSYFALDDGGEIRVTALAAPSTADITVEEWQIASLDRAAIGSGSNGLPVYKVTVQADAVATVQPDLAAAAVNPARYASGYRSAATTDAAVKVRHPLSAELIISSPLRDITDAQAVADALLPLIKIRRDVVECGVKLLDVSDLFVGATVTINTTRLGYPRSFILLGWRLDANADRTYLNLWG
jgi:hypothetical protein